VSSVCGIIVTLVLYCVLVAYGIRKGQTLVFRESPEVSLFEIKNQFSSQDWLDLDSVGFKIAFTVVDYYTLKVLDDPTMVEWVVLLQTYKNLQLVEEYSIKTHKCNQQDWSQFYKFDDVD
jgi:hypothetical protein